MSEQSVTDASAAVAADPFWSVVRRHHPEIDIVLLPEPPAPPDTAGLPLEDPDAAAAAADDAATRRWYGLVDDREPVTRARWRSGPTPDTLVRETTLHVDGVDPVTAVATVARAAEVLAGDGWRVLTPPDGLPRTLAGREEGIGRCELQLVHAPATGRLVLRVRSAPVVVGEQVARTTPRSAA